jgi:hypothetical protein
MFIPDPRSWLWIFFQPGSRIQGGKKAFNPGSATPPPPPPSPRFKIAVVSNFKGANVPQTFRYLIGKKQKTIELFPKFVFSKEILSIWPSRADSGQNRNSLFLIREIRERYQNVLVSFPKRYRNVCPFVFTSSDPCQSKFIHL